MALGLVIALAIIIVLGALGSFAIFFWLTKKVYELDAENAQLKVAVAAYKEGLKRPAVALLTQDQVEYLASMITGKKEYIN